jgi:hypothetical protein
MCNVIIIVLFFHTFALIGVQGAAANLYLWVTPVEYSSSLATVYRPPGGLISGADSAGLLAKASRLSGYDSAEVLGQ